MNTPKNPLHPERFTTADILSPQGELRPWILELIAFRGGIPFQDILHILRDNTIHPNIRSSLAGLIHESPLEEVRDFLADSNIPENIRGMIARKLKKTSLQEIRNFLQDANIPENIRQRSTECLLDISLEDVQDIILDPYLPKYIKQFTITHLNEVSFEQIKGILANPNISEHLRIIIAEKITPIPFLQIKYLLEDTELSENLRVNIGKSAESVSFEKAEDFIKNESIELEIRQPIAEKIRKIPFAKFIEYTKDNDLSEEILITMTNRIEPTSFQEAKVFLGDNSLSQYVRNGVAKNISVISFKEAKEIIRNDEYPYSVKIPLLFNLERTPLSEDVKKFLENEEIDDEFRYKVAEKIQWNTPDYAAILKKIPTVPCHAEKINQHQLSKIHRNTENISAKRTLVLYFRENQWGFLPHTEIFATFLKQYIQGQHSPIWNDFKIITRFGDIDTIWGIPAEHHEWVDFKSTCGICADTFHISHGTPIDSIPDTHAILWKAIFSDPNKIYRLKKSSSTKFEWLYYGWTSKKTVQKLTGDTGLWFPLVSSEELIDMLLSSIQKAERQILINTWIIKPESTRKIKTVRKLIGKVFKNFTL